MPSRLSRAAGPYSIGSDMFPGLSKVAEESGEILQVIGKIIGSGGDVNHWDGTHLGERLLEEVADLQAALDYLVEANAMLDANTVAARRWTKLQRFRRWDAEARVHHEVTGSGSSVPHGESNARATGPRR